LAGTDEIEQRPLSMKGCTGFAIETQPGLAVILVDAVLHMRCGVREFTRNQRLKGSATSASHRGLCITSDNFWVTRDAVLPGGWN
jgi:hypothetical protein